MAAPKEDTFFNKNHQGKVKKNATEEAAFKAITSREASDRVSKTAKLRELRLQKEAENPPAEVSPKPSRSRPATKRAGS